MFSKDLMVWVQLLQARKCWVTANTVCPGTRPRTYQFQWHPVTGSTEQDEILLRILLQHQADFTMNLSEQTHWKPSCTIPLTQVKTGFDFTNVKYLLFQFCVCVLPVSLSPFCRPSCIMDASRRWKTFKNDGAAFNITWTNKKVHTQNININIWQIRCWTSWWFSPNSVDFTWKKVFFFTLNV